MTHRTRPRSTPTLLALLFVACATGRGADETLARSSGAATQVINKEDIAASNARTAWEALQSTVKYVHWGVGQAGAPQRGTRRGVTSGMGPERVRVLMDGSDVHDLAELRLIPATDLEEIVVLSGVDATTYFGTNTVAGAVLITTRR